MKEVKAGKVKLKQKNILLRLEQLDKLRNKAFALGVSESELVRQALDKYL